MFVKIVDTDSSGGQFGWESAGADDPRVDVSAWREEEKHMV
jgi:hypothetical protein